MKTALLVMPLYIAQPATNVWPFSLEGFDCNPELSKYEKELLNIWQTQQLNPNSLALSKLLRRLSRLVRPIEVALTHYGGNRRLIANVRNHMLSYMCKMRTSLWAWSETEWLDYIGRTPEDFVAKNGLLARNMRIQLAVCSYLLTNINVFETITGFQQYTLAKKIFGIKPVNSAIEIVQKEMLRLGHGKSAINTHVPILISEAFLLARDAELSSITTGIILKIKAKPLINKDVRHSCVPISAALHSLGIISQRIKVTHAPPRVKVGIDDNLSNEWLEWIHRWHNNSTLASVTRRAILSTLARIGRWIFEAYGYTNPNQWTFDTSIAFVAAVTRVTVGEWSHPKSYYKPDIIGKPLNAHSKLHLLSAARTFFADCQEWNWLPRTFNPLRSIPIPQSILSLLGPNPRIIEKSIWAKIMHAGLNLTEKDLYENINRETNINDSQLFLQYPFELVKAVTIVWLFAGLRYNEIKRLRVGCIRWDSSDLQDIKETGSFNDDICLLTVPVNKTSSEFVKPVDPLVGKAIEAWEKIRPKALTKTDLKTGEMVHFLFYWKENLLGRAYVNRTIIPMLCQKAGVPPTDVRGNITSHRARATIATQLYNSNSRMELFDLQAWLGHKNPTSTQHYVKILPTKLAEAYKSADYFKNNLRMIDVLMDKNAIASGSTSETPLLYYDLIHGYCTNPTYYTCPHRMACAKCDFYRSKESSPMQLLEAKGNIIKFQQTIPISEEENLVINGDINELEKLITKLQDVKTPAGPTPRDIMPPVNKTKKKDI